MLRCILIFSRLNPYQNVTGSQHKSNYQRLEEPLDYLLNKVLK